MEVWKDIEGYDGVYQISNYGRCRSRYTKNGTNYIDKNNWIFKNPIMNDGYGRYVLISNRKRKKVYVHHLVWKHFSNIDKNELVIDHIDFDRMNNHIDNLQLLTRRENSSKSRIKKHSKLIGARKTKNKWYSSIRNKKENIYLGVFETELDAHNAYQEALEKISNRDGK